MNPHLERLEAVEEARNKWLESEWRLNFLRLIAAEELLEPNEEELLVWARQYKPLKMLR